MKGMIMKRICLLPILLLFFIFSTVSAKNYKNFEYSVQTDETVRIDSYAGTVASVTIPSRIDGLPVVSIGEGAFAGNDTLKEIIFESESITLEARSFMNCSGLKNVVFTNKVKSIVIGSADWTPFVLATSLNSLTIPDTAESLVVNKAGFVFSSLKTLTIGSTNVMIDSYAFDTPFQLSEIIFTQNVRNITLGDGIDPLFYTAEMLTEFIIPDTVASLMIKQNAMAKIASLQTVSIGSADTTIEKNAFSGCNDLASVIFTNPSATNDISEMAFSDCPKLKDIVYLTAEEIEDTEVAAVQIDEQDAVRMTADALVASVLAQIESTAGYDIFYSETSTPTISPTNTHTPIAVPTNTPTQIPTFTPTATSTATPKPTNTPASESVLSQPIDELISENREYIEKNLINPSEQFVIEKLSGLDVITEIAAATEDHDPNGNLHKQGGYTSAVYFTTTYLDPSTVNGNSIIDKGTNGGGQIEVYETVDNAINRDNYLSSFGGAINPGSHIVLGSMVIRTSKYLPASQQKELERIIVAQFITTSPTATENSIEAVKTPLPSSYYRGIYGEEQKTISVKVLAKGSGRVKVYDQPTFSGNVVNRVSGPLDIDLVVDPVYADGTNWVMGKDARRISGWVPVENLVFPEPETKSNVITDAKNDAYQKLYDQAAAMLKADNYDMAKLLFETISDYSDAAEMIRECDYQHALALESAGSYVDAMVTFTLLGDYKDSSDHVLQNALQLQLTQENNDAVSPSVDPTITPMPTAAAQAVTNSSEQEMIVVAE